MREWALIGFGYWGPKVARASMALPDVRVAAVCDLDPARAAAAAVAYPHLRVTSDPDGLLGDERIDAVLIATPAESHYSLARAALLAGKHVHVEKPLVTSVAGAADLIQLAQSRRRLLRTGHTYLHSPAVQVVRRVLDEGWLGELRYIQSVRRNLGTYRRNLNVIWDLAAHDISILLAWLGRPPAALSAQGWGAITPSNGELARLTLTYDEGIVATIDVSWVSPVKERCITLVGTRAMLVYDDMREPKVTLYKKGMRVSDERGEVLTWDQGEVGLPTDPVEPLQRQLIAFWDAIDRAGEGSPFGDPFDLTVVQMLAAADRSLALGGLPVDPGGEPEGGRVP